MWKIIENKNWEHIRNTFSWIQDLEGVPQDKIYHAEGDVAVHTRMVMEALLNLEEYQELEEQEREILFGAALLHDVEKRSTTVIEPNGRITSGGHAKKGEYTARNILYKEIPTSFKTKETIAKLVRFHGFPLWVFEKPNPQKALFQASMEVDTKLLYLLSKADVLGRICEDQEELLHKVELFREYCIEQNCLGQARPFESDLGRYQYFQKEEGSADYIPFEKDCFEVVMMSALPGTGKDTFIKNNFKEWPIVSLDSIRRANRISPKDSKGNGRVIQLAKEEARVLLRQKKSFVWNATNITRNLRHPLISLFQSYGAKTRLVYLEVPYQQLKNQNLNRAHPVPQNILEKMIRKLEVPSIWEAPIVDYVCESS